MPRRKARPLRGQTWLSQPRGFQHQASGTSRRSPGRITTSPSTAARRSKPKFPGEAGRGGTPPFAIPSSRNLLSPEGVQAAEEFFQADEG